MWSCVIKDPGNFDLRKWKQRQKCGCMAQTKPGKTSPSPTASFCSFSLPSAHLFLMEKKKIPNRIVINQRKCDEYYSICTPALVSCCFVWVSQTVTMTTASSYWTDVICDIMLNGKEKEEETRPEMRRMEQNLLSSLFLIPPKAGSWGMAALRLMESWSSSGVSKAWDVLSTGEKLPPAVGRTWV